MFLLMLIIMQVEDPNLYALSELTSKLLECFGKSGLTSEDLSRHFTRSLRKNKGCGDIFLSFTRLDDEKVRLCIDGSLVFNLSQVCNDLPRISEKWTIPISTCSSTDSALILSFKRVKAFNAVIHNVLSQGSEYGTVRTTCQEYARIRYRVDPDEEVSDLSETRVAFGARVVGNLLQASGYQIEINSETTDKKKPKLDLYFTHKSTDDGMPPGSQCVTCGVVLNAKTGCKENQLKASDYFRQWEEIINKVSQERENGDLREVQSEINAHIAKSAVLFDLLGIKLSSSVSLKLPMLENHQCYGVSSKGAPFILYNTARVATILSQFQKKVDLGYYPNLPPLDQIDMSLLTNEEEWTILIQYILTYPFIIKESLTGLNEGKPSTHIFVAFINAFCKEISLYYRKIRILMEPRLQLLPVMFARLYLIKTVEQVLHNALTILNIKPLLRM